MAGRNYSQAIKKWFNDLMWKKILVCTVTSFILSTASLYLVHIPWLFGDEDYFVTFPTAVKKWINIHVLPNKYYDTSFIENNFLIINVTQDQQLTKDEKDIHRQDSAAGLPITNREKLTQLFKFFSENDTLYNIIICDIFFENKSIKPNVDDTLQKYIGELESSGKIIFAIGQDALSKNKNLMMIRKENFGITSFAPVKGNFYTEKLIEKGAFSKNLSVLMFERINNTVVSRNSLGL